MFSVKISEELASDLSILGSLPSEDEVQDFCKMSTQLILQGPNPKSGKIHDTLIPRKILEKAALKLNLDDPIKIDKCIGGIAHLYLEASKLKMTPDQLSKNLHGANIPHYSTVSAYYKEKVEEIGEFLIKSREPFLDLRHYKKLDWRLDCVVASRAKPDQLTPMFTLKLETQSKSGQVETHLLQTDPVNLVHLTDVLEKALGEMKSNQVRKIQKYL